MGGGEPGPKEINLAVQGWVFHLECSEDLGFSSYNRIDLGEVETQQ